MEDSPKKTKTPTMRLVFLRTVVVLGIVDVLAAVVLGGAPNNDLSGVPTPRTPKAKQPRPAEEVAKPHLSKAQQECERAIEEHVKKLDSFFAECKKGTPVFAEDALGWGSKWRLIKDFLPFTRSDRHEEFIKDKFEEHIFNPQQLEDAVKQVVKSYIAEVRSIESKMLVRLRADTGDFPSA